MRALLSKYPSISHIAILFGVWMGTALLMLGGSAIFPSINQLGIQPRELGTIWHILTAPLLHMSFGHLFYNFLAIAPIVIFLSSLYAQWRRTFVLCYLGSGLMTWMLGAPGSVHIGASGVLYALLGYLFLSGFFSRHWKSVLGTVLTVFFFSYAARGLWPAEGVSWAGHFGGALAGGLIAWLDRKRVQKNAPNSQT